MAAIGRARWKYRGIQLPREPRPQSQALKLDCFRHGKHGLANLLATLNQLAFNLQTLLEQRSLLAERGYLPHWTGPLEAVLGRRQLVAPADLTPPARSAVSSEPPAQSRRRRWASPGRLTGSGPDPATAEAGHVDHRKRLNSLPSGRPRR